ncbi:hypothetical protein BC827DRAFT_772004 [Russula dissimulans]|nr:hypothetical protein BC827DRAFT_772004 [Russula dissimulans]
MTDDNCSDCGLAHLLHIREDGIYECPPTMSVSGGDRHEPMSLHVDSNGTMACPGRYVSTVQDGFSEYADSSMRSDSPDPLLLAPDKQLPQRHYLTMRRSAQPEGTVVPMRRSAHLENRRRTRQNTEPYAQAEAYRQARRRRSSLRMAEDPVPVRRSRPRRVSSQDCQSRRCENAAVFPARQARDSREDHDYYPPRRKSLQPHVLKRMVPVEDMEPIEGFRPFTELDSGQSPVPVTIREPMRELVRPPFEFVWKPSVVVPAVGGMRVRVGQFERRGPLGHSTPFPSSNVADTHEDETGSQSSGSEGYFTARDWSSSSTSEHNPWDHGGPSINTFLQTAIPPLKPHYPPQPEFIQGSSRSMPPLQQVQQSLVDGPRDTYPPSVGHEFPQFEALAQHYAAVQNRIAPLPRVPPLHHAMGSAPSASTFASCSLHHPKAVAPPCPQQSSSNVTSTRDHFTPTPTPMPMPTTPQPSQNPQSHTVPKAPRRSSMPCTLPGFTLTTSTPTDGQSESPQSIPDRGETEAAVDAIEDWATREPWEYVHHVLTSSTCPLVMFLKTPTGDIPAAALGALGADLRLQKMLVDNEHWLLVGPPPDRDDVVDLYEFAVRFQTRAGSPDRFVFRFGNLNWGADVNQIEDEVFKAAMERSRRGRGVPATLPAQFMAGAVGGFVVWYALSLM